MTTPNIVITGFMGTGKSTVGRRVAAALGRPFVDLDNVIVERAGRDISRIFAEDGAAAFRQLEAAVLDEVAVQEGLVIATGGGTLVSARNRRKCAANGIMVCLQAAPATIEARLRGDRSRPLAVAARSGGSSLRALLAGRAHAYRQIPHQIDTTGRSVDEVVADVLAAIRDAHPHPEREVERAILTLATGGYSVVFDRIDVLGELLRERRLVGKVAIVTNEPVGQLYAFPLQSDLAISGLETEILVVPEGERHKTLATAEGLYTQLLECGFDRGSTVVALGGGVIGDLAGFVAATYMRGVPFVQAPTSLLAMVDASVGGKVAVDHPRAKNLVGAFKQPDLVLIDTTFLRTLPEHERRNGLAEVIKHGIIGAPELFERLERAGAALAVDSTLVREALAVKVAVVEEDPFERGRRAVLNLGHTFAHAFEVLSNFEIAHGEAVAIGLVAAARLSAALGHASPELPERVRQVVTAVGLPTHFDRATPGDVWQAMQGDKKKTAGRLRFVLPRAIGDVFVTDTVPEGVAIDIIAGLASSA